MKTTRIYPLSAAANPPATVFVNGSGQEIDTIFPDSGQYFADLAWMIEREPHDRIPSHERFQLAAIGIEKGKAFSPDEARKALFDEAARCGAAMARANSFDSDDPARLVYGDRRWEWAFIGGSASWDSQGYVNTDRRAGFAYIAIGMSPAMVEKHVGTGSQYLWTPRDASGAFLDGGKRYRLHVPPDIPVKNFWSVVAYDADSRSILRSGQRFPSVSTYTAPATNPDGSIDINFGPDAPAGPTVQQELDPDHAGQGLVRALPLLRAARTVLRPELEARRHRRGSVVAMHQRANEFHQALDGGACCVRGRRAWPGTSAPVRPVRSAAIASPNRSRGLTGTSRVSRPGVPRSGSSCAAADSHFS